MVDAKVMNVIGFFTGLLFAVIGFLSFSIGGQMYFVVNAYIDDTVWEDDLKYINTSLTGANLTADANLKTDYADYLDFKTDNSEDITNLLGKGGLVVSLLGLTIVIVTLVGENGILGVIMKTFKKEK